jgi:mannose-1-phosphate guanylyltransferase
VAQQEYKFMKAVILAGGLGKRLRPLTSNKPKPMLPLGGKPILLHVINWVKKNDIKEIVLCVSYLHKTIEDYFGDGKKFGVKIEYAISSKPLATAGQLKTAEKFIDDTFVCVYGDTLLDFNLKNMIRQHKEKKSFVTMSLYEYKTNIRYGVIDTKNNGNVSAWNEKPEIKAKVNIGCYVMEPATLGFIPKNRPFGMDTVIKKAISKRKAVNSFLSKKGFIDIGDKETYEKTNLQYRKKTGKI